MKTINTIYSVVPLLYSDPHDVEWSVVFDIFDGVKECRRIVRWADRVREVSVIKVISIILVDKTGIT